MESIYIHLEHCYGIPSFNYTFRFDNEREKAHLIYAPNGTMKSSFAHTLHDVCADHPVESRDRYFPERPYCRIIRHDSEKGTDLDKDEIFVVESRKEYYYTEKMSLFLANEKLKAGYDLIHRTILENKEKILKLLTNLSAKKDALSIFCRDFRIQDKEFFDKLSEIFHKYEGEIPADFRYIKYGKLFSDEVERILSSPEVVEKLDRYIDQYSRLLSSSTVFVPVFSHTSAEDIEARLEKSGFFAADHKVMLNGYEEPLNGEEFKKLIAKEKNRIINEELVKEFNEIDALLSAKNATTEFRAFLYEHKEIIPLLRKLPEFKEAIWISYLFSAPDNLRDVVSYYEHSKLDIEKIISEAEGQQTEWEEVVDEFNRRFIDMPFFLRVENKEDVILEEKAPALEFLVKTGDADNPYRTVERELLLVCLSEGEKRALFILNVMFEIMALKKLGKRVLIIFDDIADSFDYKNKYAIIEYLIDIINEEYLLPIILTHNFDFYRTLASRSGLEEFCHFVIPKSNEIELSKGEYTRDVFNIWRTGIHKNNVIFIASIAFARNLAQYKGGQDIYNYELLTRLLHYKKNSSGKLPATEKIQLFELFGLFREIIDLEQKEFVFDPQKAVYEFIIESANDIIEPPANSSKLENKILLAIAIRLITDKYMIFRIGNDATTDKITINQTRELKKLIYFDPKNPEDVEREKIIDRVLIVSSENIHLNSFMYEPIIDLSLGELIKLYYDVSHKLVWKD